MRSFLRLLVWVILIAAGFTALARATAIRWWQVPANDLWLAASVMPSMAPGDWILLWRLTRPHEGDLVMCPEPGAPERIVIGRVLGTGNDTIAIEGGQITLNNKSLRREGGCDSFQVLHPKSEQTLTQACSIEDLDGDLFKKGHLIKELNPPPKMVPVTVEPGKFFLVSDNRQFPLDSRDFGTVDAASCTETVIFRLWGAGGYFDPNRRFELVQ
jgi:signal peptidase I